MARASANSMVSVRLKNMKELEKKFNIGGSTFYYGNSNTEKLIIKQNLDICKSFIDKIQNQTKIPKYNTIYFGIFIA